MQAFWGGCYVEISRIRWGHVELAIVSLLQHFEKPLRQTVTSRRCQASDRFCTTLCTLLTARCRQGADANDRASSGAAADSVKNVISTEAASVTAYTSNLWCDPCLSRNFQSRAKGNTSKSRRNTVQNLLGQVWKK
ncbi:hypothetical protein RRG08_057408 [Elysia crispata]|uniref:Uncharacterized protein n=1 Tax=Elysia crispata TaxID=231223 RepID=A0AAE1ACW4_9GAST|nr:hypothetical protein RRG08_057408 [Elysia crispata]